MENTDLKPQLTPPPYDSKGHSISVLIQPQNIMAWYALDLNRWCKDASRDIVEGEVESWSYSCSKHEWKWSYKIPNSYLDYFQHQSDWNQTLITRLNEIYANNRLKGSFRKGNEPITIKVPKKLRSVIESFEYFNKENSTLSSRYFVEFDEADSNIIMVGNVELLVENF